VARGRSARRRRTPQRPRPARLKPTPQRVPRTVQRRT
jgi:hypothetical protein